jgi:preprotein translocase subunit SecB
MSEQEAEQRQFVIQRIYTKDASFELPQAPDIFLQEWEPKIDINLSIQTVELNEHNIEVVVTVQVEGTQDDKVAFLVEVQQAGIFLVVGFSEEEKAPLLHIGAANALFPYVREVVSSLVSRGSLPTFTLQPVNFEAMYQQRLAEQAEAADEQSAD